ncbi:TraB/GumN family protein [Brevibacillus reuszeri]|uniref:TraB/GumN family protein n=1 Tax=Brevibacillus reuszeri TaxID=54915 RepID=UPI003D1F3A0E
MKLRKWSSFSRLIASGVLGLTTILGSVYTVQADEVPAAPSISQWSIPTLHEGEKYGIFPLSWYYDGTFQKPITTDKFQALVADTTKKLDGLGLKKKGTLPASPAAGTITRETVTRTLYAILTQYELPQAFEIDKYSANEYLQKKGIVQGTPRGLQLDQPSTTEQAAVLASRLVAYAYDTAQAGAKGLLWKATKGENTLYLLGSIHLGNPDMYPLSKEVREAFTASDSLFVEVNMASANPEDMKYFTDSMMLTDGTTLEDHISKETYEKLQKVLDKLELPMQAFETVKPWAITTSLSMSTLVSSPEDMNQAATLGVDMYFLQSAMLTDKPIEELEGLKLQSDVFNNVPMSIQEKEMNDALDAILNPTAAQQKNADEFTKWQQQWAKGDVDGFTKSFTSSQDFVESDSAKRLFGERDKNMATKIAALLDKKGKSTYFVVVGAGHFVLKDMIIDQLKQKGYQVEFVK